MRKTIAVAVREFLATVATKGFIIAVFLPFLIMAVAIPLTMLLMPKQAPKVVGQFAVIDRSGAVAPKLQQAFTPEALRVSREKKLQRTMEKAAEVGVPTPMGSDAMKVQAPFLTGPDIALEVLPPDTSVEDAKAPILAAAGREKENADAQTRLALAVIPPEAVKPDPSKGYSGYELFVAPKLDPDVQDDIRDLISRAMVDSRLESANLNVAQVRSIIERPKADTRVVTAQGEREASPVAAMMIPMGFMMLLWISVFSGGQYLLTSTVEEKGSRVMEVLLSAVSPLELMVGKILGQMAVAMTILAVYMGMGIGGLKYFQQAHLLDWVSFVYLAIFFVIAFFLIASMMAAIGSAVNDMREAQALLGPVMMVLIIPMMLWLPISRNPNSVFAQVCSFVPPINPFIMVLRIAGSEKVPAWQIPVSIAIGAAGAAFAAWSAAKIFRIGVLMYGKPPNLQTLVKWVRMA